MQYYDYKVIPAPERSKKVKGVKGASDLFAHTLTDAINELANRGWEYVRSETITTQTPRGWFRRDGVDEVCVLVFRRARADFGASRGREGTSWALTPPNPDINPADRFGQDPNPTPRVASNATMADRVRSTQLRGDPPLGDRPNSSPLRPKSSQPGGADPQFEE